MISGCGELVVGEEAIEMKAVDCIPVESSVPRGFRLIKENLEVLEFFAPGGRVSRRSPCEKAAPGQEHREKGAAGDLARGSFVVWEERFRILG